MRCGDVRAASNATSTAGVEPRDNDAYAMGPSRSLTSGNVQLRGTSFTTCEPVRSRSRGRHHISSFAGA